ncbi:MAG TPA: hypothetical protein VIC58_06085 [Actinomycetota bacterium]|jgi:hypothetical protein
MSWSREVGRVVDDLEDAVADGVEASREFLASPTGQRVRRIVAGGLVLAAPIIFRHPFFRTPIGRVIVLAGGAAILTKAADAIRDWEPVPPNPPPFTQS